MRPEDLTAYLDGELPPDEAERVERALEQDPELRRRLADLCGQRLMLAETFREAAAEDRPGGSAAPHRRVPSWLRLRGLRPQVSSGIFWGSLAAGLALALLAFFSLSRRPPGPDLAREGRKPETAPAPVLPDPGPEVPPPVEERGSEKPGPRREAPSSAPERKVPAVPERPVEVPAAPAPGGTPPPPAEERPLPRPDGREIVGLFRLDEVQGEAWIEGPSGRSPARRGDWLGQGQGLEVAGQVVIRYPDGTLVEAGANSALAPVEGEGKRLRLVRGGLHARVARQPEGTPMIFLTPQAEARVLGTTLRLVVEGEATRLEVFEGRVRLKRLADGRSVDVPAGHYAVAAAGAAPVARPLEAPDPVALELEEFGTARGVQPADGPVRRLFREPLAGASGGWCVAAPGIGTGASGDFFLARGLWHLWIRYRDENMGAVAFEVLVNGKVLGSASGTGKSKDWIWKRFSFPAEGKVRVSLRSTSEAVRDRNPRSPNNPYGIVNRWDRIVLTRDAGYSPEK